MRRSTQLITTMLLVGLWGAGTLAAQAVRGSKALEAGDYVKAIAAFKEATKKKNKEWCSNSFYLAFAYYKNQQVPEALAVFDDIFANGEKLSCNTWGFLPAWHYWRGRAAFDSGRFKDAASYFAAAAEAAPTALPADFWPQMSLRSLQPIKEHCYSWLGSARQRLGSYQEAVDAYKKAVEQNPKDGQHYADLAESYLGLKQYDDALAAAKRAVEVKPDWYALWSLGDVYIARAQFAEAAEAFRKAAESNPKRADIFWKMGQARLGMDDHEGAAGAFAKGVELAPSEPALPYWIGIARSWAGRFEEATAAFDKAVALASFVGVGVRINTENGLPVIQRTTEGDPGIDEGPGREAGLKAGDAIMAIQGWPTKGNGQEAAIQRLRGEANTPVALTIQRPGEAKPLERTVTRRLIVPKTAAPYFGERSLAARERGLRDLAVKDAEQAYALDPENVQAREALAAVRLDAGDYEAAVGLLTSLGDNPFARLLEATAYAKRGDAGKAVEVYAAIPDKELKAVRALRQNARKALLAALGGHVRQTLDKAQASESAGRNAEALATYAEALKAADDETAGLVRQRAASLLKRDPSLAELPEEARKHALRGDVLINDGRFGEALTEYAAAVKLAPFNPPLHFNTALIHGQLKAYREAVKSMNVYLQLLPDAPNARAAKDEIYKWEFALEQEGKK
jgi:tetratricopeptide (TPR) repeat protein